MATTQDNVQVTMFIDGKQAINELGKLEMEANELKFAMKENKRGTEEYIKANARMKEVKKQISDVRKEIGLSGMTMGQLRKYQRELNNELRNTATFGTKRYKELKTELQGVNAQINKQTTDVKKMGGAWSSMKSSFAQFAPAALAVTAITAAVAAVPKWISANVTLSDSLTDVQKYTDLTNQEMDQLLANLDKMNTRSSREELLGLAEVAGKLGIKGVKDIEGFVRAADKINVALAKDLGGNVEDVMRELGKITSTYKVKEAFGIEDSLLKVSSAINTLGASSEASEGRLVDFAKRMGGIAPLAKLSIEDILGMGATLDSLGQTMEVSSSALSKLFTSMGKNTKEFAKVAGMEIGKFTKLMNEDANEALIKVLEGVKSNADSLPLLTSALGDLGQDGGRVVGVIGTLANNIDVLRNQQEISAKAFKDGTSVIDEFDKKNNNLAATLQKIKNFLLAKFVTSGFVKEIERMAKWIASLLPATETAQQGLEKLRHEFNLEMEVLKRGNFTQEQRARLIGEINEKYGDYLPNLLSENASLEDIRKAQEAVNDAMLSRIILMDYEEEIAEAYKKQKESAEALYNIEKNRQKLQMDDKTGYSPHQKDVLQNQLNIMSGINQTMIDQTDDTVAEIEDKYSGIAEKLGLDFQKIKNALSSSMSGGGLGEDEDAVATAAAAERDKEFERLLKQWEDFNTKLEDQKEAFRISQLEKDQQEIANIENKYANLSNQNREFLNQKVIDQATYDEMETNLQAQQDAELNALFAARNEKLKQDKADFKAEIEMMSLSENEREIAEVEAHYEKLIALAKEYGLDITSLEKLKADELAEINQKARDEETEEEIAALRLQAETYSAFGGLMAATNSFIGESGAEMTEFQKALILVQIALDTAAAMSSALAGATAAGSGTGPAAVVTTPLFIAEMFALVIGAAAKVKNAFGDAGSVGKAPSAKEAPTVSFYDGGPTNRSTGLGFGDNRGEYAGFTHFDEYVIPSYVRRDPVVVDAERYIEAKRKGRSYYDGGPTGRSPQASPAPAMAPASSGFDNKKLDQLIEETRATRMEFQKAQDKKVYVTYKDIDETKIKYEKVKVGYRL